jgi:hypothetical protein
MHLLDGWYPGFGEVEKIRRMSPRIQAFISNAARENPDFIEGYLLPTLDSHDAEGKIIDDLHRAIYNIECQEACLGGYEYGSSWLEKVPASLGAIADGTVVKYGAFRKERKRITAEAKHRAQAELAAAKATKDKELIAREKQEYRQEVKTARHTFEKEKVSAPERKALVAQIGKPKEGHHWEYFRDNRTGEMIATQVPNHKSGNFFRKAGGAIRKTVKKYGNVLISAAGIILAIPTGGASLAIAAAITLANGVRQKRIAANKAKREGKHAADKMVKEVEKEQAQAGQQMDQFYSQNQQWFVDNLGLTPDKWAALTFDQKVDILQNGMRGRAPGNAPPPTPGDGLPWEGGAGGGGAPAPGGGYGTPGGGGGSGGESAQPGAAPGGPQVATASMFDGAMLPLLVGGVALALIFGKPVKGGRRAKRNPRRRRWRVA